jgi:Domain of unknown function (DUF4399)
MSSAMIRNRAAILSGFVVGIALACGGGGDRGGAAMSVEIVAPTNGAVITGDRVTIELAAHGVTIVPAGTDQPNSGHHHLFIDRDVTPVGQPIPTEAGIVHLGAAQTSYVIEGLQPGEHRVIAVLGNFQHVRLGTVASDTVRFTVASP